MELTLGLLMGIAYIASPGPVLTETLRRGAVFGFPAAFAVQAGGMVGHMLYVLLAYSGIAVYLGTGGLSELLGVLSFVLLLYLGISTIKDRNLLGETKPDGTTAGCSVVKTVLVGSMVSVFNPTALAFWLSLSSQADSVPIDSTLFLCGFLAGVVLVGFGLALLACYGMKALKGKWAQFVVMGCGVVLIGFGIKIGYGLVQGLL